MHEIIHGDEPLGRGDYVPVMIPAVNEDCYVMVPVKKYQFLFPQDNEICIY